MLKKNLEQREKPELIAIIQHMLRQEPELQWLLMTALPTASSRKSSLDPEVYRQQVLAAMTAGYRFDVDHDGFGLTKDIPPEFLQDTTPEEKHLAAQCVRTALAELQEKKPESDWRRKRYGGLLLALEADVLSDEEFLRIGRETK